MCVNQENIVVFSRQQKIISTLRKKVKQLSEQVTILTSTNIALVEELRSWQLKYTSLQNEYASYRQAVSEDEQG